MSIPRNLINGLRSLEKKVKTDDKIDKTSENIPLENAIQGLEGYIQLPSFLTGFTNTKTEFSKDEKNIVVCYGELKLTDEDYICPSCNCKMHINDHKPIKIKHLPFGSDKFVLKFERVQMLCDKCGSTKMQKVEFKEEKHFITKALKIYTRCLLASGHYTNTEVSELTGLNRNIVKEIDLERLKELYTVDGKTLIKPEQQAYYLGIDEFKLHNGYKYATHIIDLQTGHILWIQEGKKKQVVYDFIEHVGLEWMSEVIAVACDMNSDFEEAFREKCPHIKIVFDHFHIVKNYNDKVIGAIRKDEQIRLLNEGKEKEAKSLKKSKYILTSSLETLRKKDKEAQENKVISKGSELFKKNEIIRKAGHEAKYEQIMKENKLLFTAEVVKEKLSHAYTLSNKEEMEKEINEIIELCDSHGNSHLMWFSKLLKNHYDGIVSHAQYNISSGKIEGINNKIKTLRREAYGYPDDEYFFLKLFDISRTK